MITVLHGDCAEKLPELAAESVDAIVTDSPYALSFMGKDWDSFGDGIGYQAWCQQWAAECLRVLKPGGHLAAFGGTRTYHRLACAIEDAGFEIRDSLHWMYGSGFPKSLNVGKAIDKAAGAERAILGHDPTQGHYDDSPRQPGRMLGRSTYASDAYSQEMIRVKAVTAPATEDAARWEGWGTALKPSHEPIILARKPLTGTVASNVLAHGTGALNVDGCRVACTDKTKFPTGYSKATGDAYAQDDYSKSWTAGVDQNPDGRWPPNILLTHSAECQPAGMRQVRNPSGGIRGDEPSAVTDAVYAGRQRVPWRAHGGADGTETVEAWECAPDCPVAELDAQGGTLRARGNITLSVSGGGTGQSWSTLPIEADHGAGDKGGASRFFPQFAWSPEYDAPFMYQAKAPRKERPAVEGVNAHPTVKPLALMRWLVRLVTPPGGTVLDPFAGTGTTGEACHLEGFDCVLVERDADYIKLIEARMSKYAQEAA